MNELHVQPLLYCNPCSRGRGSGGTAMNPDLRSEYYTRAIISPVPVEAERRVEEVGGVDEVAADVQVNELHLRPQGELLRQPPLVAGGSRHREPGIVLRQCRVVGEIDFGRSPAKARAATHEEAFAARIIR